MPTMHWRDAEREAARRRHSPAKRKKSFSQDALNPANQAHEHGGGGSGHRHGVGVTMPASKPHGQGVSRDRRTETTSPADAASSPDAPATALQSSPCHSSGKDRTLVDVYATDDTITGPSASDTEFGGGEEQSGTEPLLNATSNQSAATQKKSSQTFMKKVSFTKLKSSLVPAFSPPPPPPRPLPSLPTTTTTMPNACGATGF